MQNPKIEPLGLIVEIRRGPKPAITNTSFLVSNTTFLEIQMGAGATFDWTFFDNSKVINFDD